MIKLILTNIATAYHVKLKYNSPSLTERLKGLKRSTKRRMPHFNAMLVMQSGLKTQVTIARVIIDIIANRTVTPTNLVIFYDDVPNPSAANISLTSNDLSRIHANYPKTPQDHHSKWMGTGPHESRPHTKPTKRVTEKFKNALADLETQKVPNHRATTKRYGTDHTTALQTSDIFAHNSRLALWPEASH